MYNLAQRYLRAVALSCAVLFAGQIGAQTSAEARELQRLTAERQMLTDELEQYRRSLNLLHTDETSPEESANPAIRTLAVQAAKLKQRLIEVARQEVSLLQQNIITARPVETSKPQLISQNNEANTPAIRPAVEGKPLRSHDIDLTQQQEAENVDRLHALLTGYYSELQASAQILPTDEELAQRELAHQDAITLQSIPYSIDKVRLNGAEGSAALAEITGRLVDPRIPESRRDVAPICLIKTRLFDQLITSENRSLRPVGKNHFIARIRLQPGDTTLTILSQQWTLRLPQHINANDYLITLFQPAGEKPELHVFAVKDLLAVKNAHIPAWLPSELGITKKSG